MTREIWRLTLRDRAGMRYEVYHREKYLSEFLVQLLDGWSEDTPRLLKGSYIPSGRSRCELLVVPRLLEGIPELEQV